MMVDMGENYFEKNMIALHVDEEIHFHDVVVMSFDDRYQVFEKRKCGGGGGGRGFFILLGSDLFTFCEEVDSEGNDEIGLFFCLLLLLLLLLKVLSVVVYSTS